MSDVGGTIRGSGKIVLFNYDFAMGSNYYGTSAREVHPCRKRVGPVQEGPALPDYGANTDSMLCLPVKGLGQWYPYSGEPMRDANPTLENSQAE